MDNRELARILSETADLMEIAAEDGFRIRSYRQAAATIEGYPESLRYLRKNSPTTSNAPLFSEIINCQPEFKSAIENFLDPYMNYFVIDNIEEASRAVNLLSEVSKGRANFFILKNFENTPDPVKENMEIGRASCRERV